MEIVVERHACSAVLASKLEDILVVGAIKAHILYVDSVPALGTE
jgi:predicted aconitase with swiveling domain